jgi:hypothetical protein
VGSYTYTRASSRKSPTQEWEFFLVEANLCGGLLWSVVFKWGPPQWGPLEWGLVERGTFERGPP